MEIKRVGVVGMGMMGMGIARHLASLGIHTTVLKWTKSSYQEAWDVFVNSLMRSVERGKLAKEEAEKICAHMVCTDRPEDLAGCELVIESIAEDKLAKRECWRKLEPFINRQAILATNTSALKIGSLARVLERGHGRFIGLHFFNPAHCMALVEVVTTGKTTSDVVEMAFNFARRIGKEPVLVASRPGFVVNRLLVAQMLEAIRLVFGPSPVVADVAAVDKAMKLGANHPMGPFELMDFIGIDVVCAMARNISAGLTGLDRIRFSPPVLLERMVEEGKLGRKSGTGFYDYLLDAKNPTPRFLGDLTREPSE